MQGLALNLLPRHQAFHGFAFADQFRFASVDQNFGGAGAGVVVGGEDKARRWVRLWTWAGKPPGQNARLLTLFLNSRLVMICSQGAHAWPTKGILPEPSLRGLALSSFSSSRPRWEGWRTGFHS